VIVSFVTETAEEVRKLLGKEDSLREISQKDRSPGGKPGSGSSDNGLKERNLYEIDPIQSLRENREARTTESAVSLWVGSLAFCSRTVGAFTPHRSRAA
jgi:type IV secretory pathway TraG/TraD family ATPase VirD4